MSDERWIADLLSTADRASPPPRVPSLRADALERLARHRRVRRTAVSLFALCAVVAAGAFRGGEIVPARASSAVLDASARRQQTQLAALQRAVLRMRTSLRVAALADSWRVEQEKAVMIGWSHARRLEDDFADTAAARRQLVGLHRAFPGTIAGRQAKARLEAEESRGNRK